MYIRAKNKLICTETFVQKGLYISLIYKAYIQPMYMALCSMMHGHVWVYVHMHVCMCTRVRVYM